MNYTVEVLLSVDAENADDAMDKVEAALYNQYESYEVVCATKRYSGFTWKD